MGFYKKTLLLTNKQNLDKGMAVFSIEKNNSGVFGSIKAYDFNNNNLVLAIKVNGEKIVKQNVFLNENSFMFKLDNDFNIDAKLGCVLCSHLGDEYKPLLWGVSGEKAEFCKDVVAKLNKQNLVLKQQQKTPEIKPQINTLHSSENSTMQSANIATQTEQNLVKDKSQLFEASDEEINETIDKELNETQDFFELISGQIEELFSKYPLDENLAKIIPNSKWVRVDYDNTGKQYIFGLIYENDNLKYIAYGVPGTFGVEPPEDMKKYSQWLPCDTNNPEIGFWVMFQNSSTGETVLIDDMAM